MSSTRIGSRWWRLPVARYADPARRRLHADLDEVGDPAERAELREHRAGEGQVPGLRLVERLGRLAGAERAHLDLDRVPGPLDGRGHVDLARVRGIEVLAQLS